MFCLDTLLQSLDLIKKTRPTLAFYHEFTGTLYLLHRDMVVIQVLVLDEQREITIAAADHA